MTFVPQRQPRATPPLYNVATLWTALQGSILLWILILAGYLVRHRPEFRHRVHRSARRLGDGGAVHHLRAFFFLLSLGPANPFGRVERGPDDGPGPNPLLQNHPLMAFHPPMLYLGYVGMSVPFAFAIAALVTGRRRRGLAARDPPLDAVRLGLPHDRHHARRLVVLRGARLGRGLGVGSGGERQLPALADRHRLHPLGARAGAAGDVAGLEPVAADAPRSGSRSSARS